MLLGFGVKEKGQEIRRSVSAMVQKNANFKSLWEIDEAYLLIKYGKLLQERHL